MGESRGEREKIPSRKLGSSIQTKGNERVGGARHKIFKSRPLDKMVVKHTGKTTGYSAKIAHIEI